MNGPRESAWGEPYMEYLRKRLRTVDIPFSESDGVFTLGATAMRIAMRKHGFTLYANVDETWMDDKVTLNKKCAARQYAKTATGRVEHFRLLNVFICVAKELLLWCDCYHNREELVCAMKPDALNHTFGDTGKESVGMTLFYRLDSINHKRSDYIQLHDDHGLAKRYAPPYDVDGYKRPRYLEERYKINRRLATRELPFVPHLWDGYSGFRVPMPEFTAKLYRTEVSSILAPGDEGNLRKLGVDLKATLAKPKEIFYLVQVPRIVPNAENE
ncbi:hypothetical protein LU11_gp307 [Pseudomonas phage Lu11]|uniref:hypothetical protein n=1 Tax=Pseudomonas phage Lu11 TaxID=1161927 RepID=UPI00025F185D|nr:hypothetical protein LU11_gp307 [Pseudomonas phage Lu11]AFH14838.1 hypothetical protein Lu11_0300 [Pseudomonas phage Lu11]